MSDIYTTCIHCKEKITENEIGGQCRECNEDICEICVKSVEKIGDNLLCNDCYIDITDERCKDSV
jgi:hypothetical protein